MARDDQYIHEVRQATRSLWEALNNLKAAQREHTALDYGTTLDVSSVEADGITKAEVTAVVFTTADAIEGLLNQGHGTNLAKLL